MLVTAVFDLQTALVKRTGDPSVKGGWRHQLQYISIFEWISDLEREIIVFTDPHLKHHFDVAPQAERSDAEGKDRVTVIETELSDLPAWQILMQHPNLEPAIPSIIKHPEYTAMITSKTHLLKRAKEHLESINGGTVPNQPLIWIDMGLSHCGS